MSTTSMNCLYWIDQLNKNYSSLVGKKSALLGELHKAGFQIPKGFALGIDIYERFMKETGAYDEIDRFVKRYFANGHVKINLDQYEQIAHVLRGIVESKQWPADIENKIHNYYEKLSEMMGIHHVPVAVRSAGPLSRPGQYETHLFARGKAEVMQRIIEVFSSTFNARSLIEREKEGLPMNFDPIGVAVIQMVHAKTAGVIFTLNPVNGDRSKILIEGNWGYGESVVGGYVTPDEWEIDKVLFEITSRKVSNKKVEYVVDYSTHEVKMTDIPAERQNAPCLTDEEILELARLSKEIEKHFAMPQDIEWVIDKDCAFPDNIFFVQTRPETTYFARAVNPKLKTTGNPYRDVIEFYRNLKA